MCPLATSLHQTAVKRSLHKFVVRQVSCQFRRSAEVCMPINLCKTHTYNALWYFCVVIDRIIPSILEEIYRKKCGRLAWIYSWKKMEATAQDTAGWRRVIWGLFSTGSDKAKVKQSQFWLNIKRVPMNDLPVYAWDHCLNRSIPNYLLYITILTYFPRC